MKNHNDDYFTSYLPALDLHGETKDSISFLINDFINDNYILKNEKLLIIHGIGTGTLKYETIKVLKKNKLVKSFHLNMFNEGCTVVYIRCKT